MVMAKFYELIGLHFVGARCIYRLDGFKSAQTATFLCLRVSSLDYSSRDFCLSSLSPTAALSLRALQSSALSVPAIRQLCLQRSTFLLHCLTSDCRKKADW